MKTEQMIERNRRDLCRYMGFTGLADAMDKVDPLPGHCEAGNSTQTNASVSADLFAPPMSSMAQAQERGLNAKETSFNGYREANWRWPNIDPLPIGSTTPLLSRAEMREVEPEQPPKTILEQLEPLHRADELYCRGGVYSWGYYWRPLPKHRFVYLSGATREERAAQ